MPDVVRPLFRRMAALRSARAFHPRGTLYEGSLLVRGPGPLPRGEADCLVRLSKGIGTPRGVPDFLGLAVRILHEPPVDVLCTTTLGATGWRRYVLWPARRWGRATLSSLMPWRSERGQRVQVVVELPGPRPAGPDPEALVDHLPVRLVLRAVGPGGDFQTGDLVLMRPSDQQRPAFDPMLHRPEAWRLVPSGLARLRERAYDGSRAGRHADRAV